MELARTQEVPDDDGGGDWLDSETRLMRVLFEQLATLPAEKRLEIAQAFYEHVRAEPEEQGNWWRKQLHRPDDDDLDRARIEAALLAKRATRR